MSEQYSYNVKIEHDFGFFLDPKHYAPLLSVNDESAVLTKLSLILENFLVVYIVNVREPETSKYVCVSRKYFAPKLELCVALGLPVQLADVMSAINALRNQYAHDIQRVMTTQDVDKIEGLLSAITPELVNFSDAMSTTSISPLFVDGIKSLQFMRELPFATPDKLRMSARLVAISYALSNFCAFFLINKLVSKGVFKSTKVETVDKD
ncbi:hypothetical protein [Citrobacter koseri]